MSAPTITFTGVFGLDALSLYNTEKRFSSIAGNILSAKIFAQDFSPGFFLRIFPQDFSCAFCSLTVNPEKLSVNDICW